jgi:hypothetical protein
MKKSTNRDARLAPPNIIISYFTILYHKNINSQYVTNVVITMVKMLYKIWNNPYF